MTRPKIDCDTYECPYNVGHDCRYDSGVVQIQDGRCRTYNETMCEVRVGEDLFNLFDFPKIVSPAK
ncbi:MAG: hypothetical protein KKB79_01440 [Nanoarchaeota archaeon]|nr:hypothetical protein [Nanoarchaeota archaeon]